MTLRRSRATSLTDDEVLLFDFLSESPVHARHLHRDAYAFHMNVGWTHDLDDDALARTLRELVERGLLEIEAGFGCRDD